MPEAYSVVKEMRGEQFKYERNDCTVTAFVKLTGMEYAKANQLFTLCGRRYGRGIRISEAIEFLETNVDFLSMLGIDSSQWRFIPYFGYCPTVGYLRENSHNFSGRYLVRISGHVFAMIEGQITDNCSNHIPITGMWKFEVEEKYDN